MKLQTKRKRKEILPYKVTVLNSVFLETTFYVQSVSWSNGMFVFRTGPDMLYIHHSKIEYISLSKIPEEEEFVLSDFNEIKEFVFGTYEDITGSTQSLQIV